MMKEKTLVILNKTFRDGFGVVPFSILKNPKIPYKLKPLYELLLSYAWYNAECFPGQDKLAEDLGVSRQTISDQLRRLKDLKLIDWNRRGLGKTNVYYILDVPDKLMYKSEPDVKKRLHQDVKKRLHPYIEEIDEEEIDKENRQASIVDNFKKNKSATVSQGLGGIISKRLDFLKNTKKKKVPEWMLRAFDYSEKLGIDWKDKSLKKIKARWLHLFKNGNSGKLAAALSFCVDYPGEMDSLAKIKLFFWKFARIKTEG